MEPRPKKLLDQVRDVVRLKHYSYRTGETYVYWIRRYILFHNKRHPKDMGAPEIETFLTHLAVEGNVAAATQNQAFNAVLFLYKAVLQQPLEHPINAFRAKPSSNLPVVLTTGEARRVIDHLPGIYQLVIKILYGSGLRLAEGLALRVKDLDFEQHQITALLDGGMK